AFNRSLDAATVAAILERQFVEVLIAPEYEEGVVEVAAKKPNVRLIRIPHGDGRNATDIKRIVSGLLVQSADVREVGRDGLKVVSKVKPSDAQLDDLLFAWRIAKFVKSNAIVYAKDRRSVG